MGLRTKFLLSLIIASAAITMTSLWMVRRSVGDDFRNRLQSSLSNSADAFRRGHQQRANYYQRTADVVANDPVLKALMALGDPATVQPETAGIRQRADASLIVLAASSGKFVALDTSDLALAREALNDRFQRSLSARTSHDWWEVDGHL